VTASTPRHQIQAQAVELVRRLGNDLVELSVVIQLADQHGLVLPTGLQRTATALAGDAIQYPTDADLRTLHAMRGEGGEAA
jgi:hypothetical protein